jgi:hypothetical protein
MKQTIYYKESGYNKTIYNFFIIDRSTKSFVFLKRLDKKEEGDGVVAGCIQSDSDIIKLSNKKFNVYFREWSNKPLIENHNYTYRGI